MSEENNNSNQSSNEREQEIQGSPREDASNRNSQSVQSTEPNAEAEGISSLKQEDVESLIREVEAQSGPVVIKFNGDRYTSTHDLKIESYDFWNPVFLTEMEMKQIRNRSEQFAHYLSARMSMFLRMDFSIEIKGLTASTYDQFVREVVNPSYLPLFTASDLLGVGIINIKPKLAMTLVNRMLGGSGNIITEERHLTEIEVTLMQEILGIFLDEWGHQWDDIKQLKVVQVGYESNSQFLQTAPHDASMLILNADMVLGESRDMIQIAVPYYMIEPLVKELQASNRRYSKLAKVEREAKWMESYDDIHVNLYAEWDACDLSVQELLSLRPGDVLELSQDIPLKTHLRLMDVSCFIGEMGVHNNRVALKVLEKVSSNAACK